MGPASNLRDLSQPATTNRSADDESLPILRANLPEHFRAKWMPVRVKKMRKSKPGAFSSEVDAGSREENAKFKIWSVFAFPGNEKML